MKRASYDRRRFNAGRPLSYVRAVEWCVLAPCAKECGSRPEVRRGDPSVPNSATGTVLVRYRHAISARGRGAQDQATGEGETRPTGAYTRPLARRWSVCAGDESGLVDVTPPAVFALFPTLGPAPPYPLRQVMLMQRPDEIYQHPKPPAPRLYPPPDEIELFAARGGSEAA
ncbi:uncharacterized protein PSFLO_02415 [Pseudozyma flocculosa]|uniref:Uncharacterized protein n=1 Tax=Pseudozyma flocculosa TaxID=84751 RepID=A0A5C3EXI6_9BASI|nr:uncharacterized protein PSFLO_02415 [Pseudozyma flocculosa]